MHDTHFQVTMHRYPMQLAIITYLIPGTKGTCGEKFQPNRRKSQTIEAKSRH